MSSGLITIEFGAEFGSQDSVDSLTCPSCLTYYV